MKLLKHAKIFIPRTQKVKIFFQSQKIQLSQTPTDIPFNVAFQLSLVCFFSLTFLCASFTLYLFYNTNSMAVGPQPHANRFGRIAGFVCTV
jgi:hypothetical protein